MGFIMNEYDVEEAGRYFADRTGEYPNLARGALVLVRLVNWTNNHSDGWPYWSKPANASKRLQELLAKALNERYRGTPTDCSAAELKAAFTWIKSFLTKQGVDHNEVFGTPAPRFDPHLVREARGLVSEDGENPEYDRALVELVIRMTENASHDEHTDAVRDMIGVRS